MKFSMHISTELSSTRIPKLLMLHIIRYLKKKINSFCLEIWLKLIYLPFFFFFNFPDDVLVTIQSI